MVKKFWFINATIISFILISIRVSFAGLSVDPVVLEVVAKKDSETKGSFKILNTGEIPVHIRVSPERFQSTDVDINNWLTLEPLEMELKKNEQKEANYKIVLPKESSGELRCMVFFVADEIGEQISNIGIRFGVPIYAIVSGTEVIDAEVKDIALNYDYKNKVLCGTIIVNNKSNVHIRPYIEIAIFDSKDKLITTFSLPYGQPAQAGQIRPFMLQQNLQLDTGRYKLVARVNYGRLYGLSDRIAVKKKSFLVKIQAGEAGEVKNDETGR